MAAPDRARAAIDAAAVDAFAAVEGELARRIGRHRVAALRRALEADWGDPPAP